MRCIGTHVRIMCREAQHKCVEGNFVENIRTTVLCGERSPTCTRNVLRKNEMHWDAQRTYMLGIEESHMNMWTENMWRMYETYVYMRHL